MQLVCPVAGARLGGARSGDSPRAGPPKQLFSGRGGLGSDSASSRYRGGRSPHQGPGATTT
eukprot:1009246-Prorocentrum_minimum.AAC.2